MPTRIGIRPPASPGPSGATLAALFVIAGLASLVVSACGQRSSGEQGVTRLAFSCHSDVFRAQIPVGRFIVLPLILRTQVSMDQARCSWAPAAGAGWRSSAPDVVSVDMGGRVTALKPGRAQVSASQGARTVTAQVVVVPAEGEMRLVPPTPGYVQGGRSAASGYTVGTAATP